MTQESMCRMCAGDRPPFKPESGSILPLCNKHWTEIMDMKGRIFTFDTPTPAQAELPKMRMYPEADHDLTISPDPAPCEHGPLNKLSRDPEVCDHPITYWHDNQWMIDVMREGVQIRITVTLCPICNKRLPESGPRKVTGLWPEAENAIKGAIAELEGYGSTNSEARVKVLRSLLAAAGAK